MLSKQVPDLLAALRKQHDTFNALLQINLTVLATAHAVSEGLIRGAHAEVARKNAPQTYGKSGRATGAAPTARQLRFRSAGRSKTTGFSRALTAVGFRRSHFD